MPFSTPNIIQGVSIRHQGNTGPLTFSFGSDLTAQSLILLVGGLVESVTSETLFFGTVTGGGTWSSAVSARDASPGDYAPNLAAAWLHNVSAGASPTFSIPIRKWNGSSLVVHTSNIKHSLYAMEIGNVPTSNAIDPAQVKFGTSGSAATETTTASTGTLSQDTHRIFGGGAGWFGDPDTQSGYTIVDATGTPPYTDTANGSGAGFVGFHLASKALTGTNAAQTYTQPHPNGGSGGAGQASIIIPVKGKATASYFYQAELPAAQFPTSTTNIVVYVWRNVGVGAEAEIYTISSPAITAKPGDATRNLLKVPADPAALLTDTITMMVMQASSGKRAGPGLGSVVSS